MRAVDKIAEGLRDAIAGNIDRVIIDGQVWVRRDKEIERLTAEREHRLCLSCGVVTRGDNCDCTKLGTDTQSFVIYEHHLAAELVHAEAEIERLRAALQPFADYARRIDDNETSQGYPDACPLGLIPNAFPEKEIVHLGHCREARRVLEGPARTV